MDRFLKLIVVAAALLAAVAVRAGGLDGDWRGALDLGQGRSLTIVLHLSAADGSVVMDSPDQGAFGIKGDAVYLDNDSIYFCIPKLMVTYAGKASGDHISGRFMQGFGVMPLDFDRAGGTRRSRPQTPRPPFPYDTEQVVINNDKGGSRLAGTLTVPRGVDLRQVPVVVMVTGSGLQNRDEELMGHKPFEVIADCLGRAGIASLRYDDRGFGESTGAVKDATTVDFAGDARAVVDWLRAQRRFGRVGVFGHSEGGAIAYMLGAEADGPDFVVSIAGPAVKGVKILGFQNKQALLKAGVDPALADDFAEALVKAMEARLAGGDADLIVAGFRGDGNDSTRSSLADKLQEAVADVDSNKWMWHFAGYDPADDLKRLGVPALIVYGDKDCQVPASLNEGVARGLAPGAVVKVYRGLNHLMQHAVTGDVSEYEQVEETFSPEVLQDIVDFILSVK